MISWIHIRQLADTGSPPTGGLATNYEGDMHGHPFFISTFYLTNSELFSRALWPYF